MYYVYEHIRLDNNNVFYVGIGTNILNNKRQNHYKRSKSKHKRSKLWNNIVNKTEYTIKIVFETTVLKEVFDKEIELIKKYGRIIDGTGNLSNISDGGNGNFGFKPTKEHIGKVIKANKGRKATSETITRMSISQKNKFVPKEVGNRISLSKKGKNIGIKIPSFSIRIKHKLTGEIFKSITQVAKKFNYRRCTLSKQIHNNEIPEFEMISEEEYFSKTGKRNWRKINRNKNVKRNDKISNSNARRND